MMKNLLKNKFLVTAAGVTLFILILVLILSPKKSTKTVTAPTGQTETTRPELANLQEEKRAAATEYTTTIAAKLPLYLENFKTSVGITTTINVYRLDTDPSEVVRLEIYGLSYLNKEADPKKNPNVTAYKESYAKAIELIEGQNIDPKKLIFIYGDKEYVRTTTETWINALNLHP